MIFFQSKLLKVDSNVDNQKNIQHRLVFQSERYDRGLEQMVPCSQPIKLHEDDHKYLEVFKTYVGKEIAVPVSLTGIDGNIYYKTTGQGMKLFQDVTTKSEAK